MTVGTRDPTHSSDFGDKDWGGRCQVDDFLTVRSWACNPLTAALANEETVARAPHVFPARGRVSDWSGLIARVALNNMLEKKFVNITNFPCFYRRFGTWSFLPEISIMLLHTRQLTMGTPPARVL